MRPAPGATSTATTRKGSRQPETRRETASRWGMFRRAGVEEVGAVAGADPERGTRGIADLGEEDGVAFGVLAAVPGDFLGGELGDFLNDAVVEGVAWGVEGDLAEGFAFAGEPGVAALAHGAGDDEVHGQKDGGAAGGKDEGAAQGQAPGGGAIEGAAESGEHELVAEKIADAANGADERVLGFAVDFVAQAMDVDVDDVGGGVDAHLPDVIEDHGAGDDAAGVAAEVFEESEFLLGELELDAGAAGFAADEVDFEIGDAEAGGFRLAGGAAAEQSAKTSLEFGDGEGLGHVVVAAAFEAEDALVDGAARGEDEDGRGDSLGAEALDQLQAVDVGEGEVDDERVVDAFEGEPLGFAAVGASVDAKAGFGERAGEKLANGGVIFDDEQPHGYSERNGAVRGAVWVFARAR